MGIITQNFNRYLLCRKFGNDNFIIFGVITKNFGRGFFIIFYFSLFSCTWKIPYYYNYWTRLSPLRKLLDKVLA